MANPRTELLKIGATDSLARLVASAMAGQALRQLEAQNANRPSVETTEPTNTSDRTPFLKGPHDAIKF